MTTGRQPRGAAVRSAGREQGSAVESRSIIRHSLFYEWFNAFIDHGIAVRRKAEKVKEGEGEGEGEGKLDPESRVQSCLHCPRPFYIYPTTPETAGLSITFGTLSVCRSFETKDY